jgi:hypothetical protein
MVATWRIEMAGIGDGLWFVAIRSRDICVIAPPGVLVTHDERERERGDGACGWRIATWTRRAGSWPVIDVQIPDSLREIDTGSVLARLGAGWRNEVWGLLVAQLEDAYHLDAAAIAVGAGLSEKWLVDDLASAFPERQQQLAALLALRGDAGALADCLEPLLRESPRPNVEGLLPAATRYDERRSRDGVAFRVASVMEVVRNATRRRAQLLPGFVGRVARAVGRSPHQVWRATRRHPLKVFIVPVLLVGVGIGRASSHDRIADSAIAVIAGPSPHGSSSVLMLGRGIRSPASSTTSRTVHTSGSRGPERQLEDDFVELTDSQAIQLEQVSFNAEGTATTRANAVQQPRVEHVDSSQPTGSDVLVAYHMPAGDSQAFSKSGGLSLIMGGGGSGAALLSPTPTGHDAPATIVEKVIPSPTHLVLAQPDTNRPTVTSTPILMLASGAG